MLLWPDHNMKDVPISFMEGCGSRKMAAAQQYRDEPLHFVFFPEFPRSTRQHYQELDPALLKTADLDVNVGVVEVRLALDTVGTWRRCLQRAQRSGF